MFEFTKKLMFAQQLKMEEGRVTLLGDCISLLPTSVLAILTKKFEEDNRGQELYYIYKDSIKIYVKNIRKIYKAEGKKLLEIMMSLEKLGGWGIDELQKLDEVDHKASFWVHKNPLPEFYGKSPRPIDHFLRGLIAGSMAEIFNDPTLEGIETQCISMGSPYCEFVIKPLGQFDEKMLKEYSYQLKL